jgi:hypothetical protein
MNAESAGPIAGTSLTVDQVFAADTLSAALRVLAKLGWDPTVDPRAQGAYRVVEQALTSAIIAESVGPLQGGTVGGLALAKRHEAIAQ